MDTPFLPTLNACLNATAIALLLRGRALVKRREIEAHKRTMIAAFVVSTAFLGFYLLHKYLQGFSNITLEAGPVARAIYLAMLSSHVVLAMTVPVFAVALITLGLRGRIERHRRLARIGWPIWMYVSVTGVLIYLILYPFNPAG